MNSWRISFIIVWNIVGELHSPKNMTVGSNSPQLVQNAAFHSSPSLICTLLNPQWRSSMVKNSVSWCRQENGPICELPTETKLMARACHYHHPEICYESDM